MHSQNFLSTFDNARPVFAMLHLKGENPQERFETAKREIDTLWQSDVDSIIVENYFGDVDDVVAVCAYLKSDSPEVTFGVNILKDDWRAFEVANEFGARFIQLDSVAGHLPTDQDEEFAQKLAEARRSSSAYVLGGVRFKYQPYLSGRSVEEDLALAIDRCDAIVVTGEGTGKETPIDKIRQFRTAVGSTFPLVVGAGVTPQNCKEQLAMANAVVVGSYLKDTFVDTGDVSAQHAQEFVRAIRRSSLAVESSSLIPTI
ncbi:MAG: BtpA/SgcQ family protein [Rhodoglobus sp.]